MNISNSDKQANVLSCFGNEANDGNKKEDDNKDQEQRAWVYSLD
jgi:hypothetical protein